MNDVSSAWKDTGQRFAALGASLRAHFEEQHGADAEATARDLGDAARRLGDAVQDAVDAVGAAAQDPAVQDDVRTVGASLAEALSVTFAQASEDLHRMAEEEPGHAPPPQAPPAPDEPGAAPTPPPRDEEPPWLEPWGTP
jgi:hypothetical protein